MTPNVAGGYAFLPAIDAYSAGVASLDGFEIIHATLDAPLPWQQGIEAIGAYLDVRGRPVAAWCGLELRSPKARTFERFAQFNRSYFDELARLGIIVDGVNPIARTNVVPLAETPSAVVIHGFSFTVESTRPETSFVTAGAGELQRDALEQVAVVRPGERTPDAMLEKAHHVLATIGDRIAALGASWADATVVDVYTTVDPGHVVTDAVLPGIGTAAARGIHWYPSAPPVDVLDFEMDARGIRSEILVAL